VLVHVSIGSMYLFQRDDEQIDIDSIDIDSRDRSSLG
jgi:hypothetical protein